MAIQIRRREFISTLCGAAASWPLAARAQHPAKISRIGVLLPGPPTSFSHRTEAFRQGLLDLGYLEGKTVIIDWRAAEEKVEQLPDLATELVRLNADIIVTVGTPAAEAAKKATQTIPIVMAVVGDAVGSGLVASLARPGGNITGFTIVAPDLSGKRLELLKEIVPGASHIAALLNPTNRTYHRELTEMQVAARTLGLRLQPVEASEPSMLEDVFATMKRDRVQALVVLTDSIFYSERRRMVDLAAKGRLPSVYWDREFVENGAFMSFGPRPADLFRRSAAYVDKILKGAKPADLPVEQPTKFELVINLKTAKALGLDIPPMLLGRADEVIE
jgi:putative tryptophan/tyrosine transport system substrate-binding protein